MVCVCIYVYIYVYMYVWYVSYVGMYVCMCGKVSMCRPCSVERVR
jgi:hypothetical protein